MRYILIFLISVAVAYGAITYDGGDDLITITGGTSGDPCTWSYVASQVADPCVNEVVTDAMYIIDANVSFGNDAGDATYFQSNNEMVYFNTNQSWTIKNDANLTIGDDVGGVGNEGASWSFDFASDFDETPPIVSGDSNAALNVYASKLRHRGTNASNFFFRDGSVTIKNSLWSSNDDQSNAYITFGTNCSWTVRDLFVSNCQGLRGRSSPVVMETIWYNNCQRNNINISGGEFYFSDIKISNYTGVEAKAGNAGDHLTLYGLADHLTALDIGDASAWIKEKYNVEIEVLDTNGEGVQGADVDVYRQASTDGGSTWGSYSDFSMNNTTGADGNTPEIGFTWAKWEGTSATKTDYRYKIIATHSSFADIKIENVRINSTNIPVQMQFKEYIPTRRPLSATPYPLYKQKD